MREPLLAPLAAVATGILVSRVVPFEAAELLIAIAASAGLAILALWRVSARAAGLSCLLAFCFCGCLLERVHRMGPPLELDAEASELVILAGCVVEPPLFSADRQRFVLELEPGARVRVAIGEREGEFAPRLSYGQKVEVEGRVRRPHNFRNPGSFDYERYLARRDIYWTASTSPSAIQVMPGECGSRFRAALFRLRTEGLERIERLYENRPYETGMMQAILLGETSRLERVWTEQFRSTGTFHALVISGAHVAVLSGCFLFLFRLFALPATLALFLTSGAGWIYALLAGGDAPVVRAAAGLTLFSIGRCFHRQSQLMNLIAAVALLFLVLDPEQLFEPSFQLSFLAVGFIAAVAVPVIERTSSPVTRALPDLAERDKDLHLEPRVAQVRVELRLLAETLQFWTRLPEWFCLGALRWPLRLAVLLWDALVVSAVVQLGLALPMAVYFHRVSFTGLSANVLIGAAMGAVVVLGAGAVVFNAGLLAALAGWALAFSQRVVEWHAAREPAWRVPPPPLWLGLMIVASLIALAIAQRGRTTWRVLSAAAAILAAALLLWHPFAPQIRRGELSVTAIDVGQGESLLVSFPDGKLLVLDGGGIPSFGRSAKSQLDIGEEVVSPYLWNRSIRSVDVLAFSHAHEDHIGGLPALLENFRPREVWFGVEPDSPIWKKVRQTAGRNGVKLVKLGEGDRLKFGGADIEALAPALGYEPRPEPHNNDSLVLRIRYKQRSFLLSGDIEAGVEANLPAVQANFIKVAHHGSKTSTHDRLLDAARPSFAIISAGPENTYGHPHPSVLDRLEQRRIGVLRTDRLGLVTIRTDGWRVWVDAFAWQPSTLGLYRAF